MLHYEDLLENAKDPLNTAFVLPSYAKDLSESQVVTSMPLTLK